jgi:hydroxymethylglutaryl-CoA lyase
MSTPVSIVEVGPRDGFQSIAETIPTATKIGLIRELHGAGLRRVEIGSFVSRSAVPQFADIVEVLEATRELPGFDPQVLVPTAKRAEEALVAGARHLVFVLSVSERHNRSNVRRSPQESVQEYAGMVRQLPAGTRLRLNLATAFDCPYDGRVPLAATLALLDQLVGLMPEAEIGLCDTTGRVTPDHVEELFAACFARYPQAARWAFHAHDTYGLGLANVVAAWRSGVRVIDASFGGLGGCPFAPGATGNVATEDVAWLFAGMGVQTGIELPRLLAVAGRGAALPGGQAGGRVREVLAARARAEQPA